MQLCYAARRSVYYPSQRDVFGDLPPPALWPEYLRDVRAMGFDGLEAPFDPTIGADQARELASVLRDAGLPAVCVRTEGPVAHPEVGAEARGRLRAAIEYAGWLGAGIVNTSLITPPTQPGGPGAARMGEPVSQGASRSATEADFVETARHVREIGQVAADLGVRLAIEIGQGSIVDNSWSGLRLLQLIDLPNVGINPDLANIYWHYDQPEETTEAAITALAPRAIYWHCKNLQRIVLPGLNRAVFLRVPLDQGDLDYRFAIAAMLAAGYAGHLAIEGARDGDYLSKDARSAAYVRALLDHLAAPAGGA
jgi:sugar phosphate isomerase/epimerase